MGIFDFIFGSKQPPAPAAPQASADDQQQSVADLPAPDSRASATQTMITPTPVPIAGPTFKGHTVPYYPNRGLGVLAAPPEYLLETQQKLIREIKQASSLSYDEFDSFILPVITNYARYVHLLPASETDHHSDLGGLFRHGLEVALIACRRAEALEFGLNENPSIRKFQVFRWRACALLGGMFHDLGKAVIDVGAVDQSGKIVWNPHVLPLWDWVQENKLEYYYVSWNPQRMHREHDSISATVIARLMPLATMRWMGEYNGRVPYDAMLLALAHSQSRSNPLIDVIHKSDIDSTERDNREMNRRMASVGEGGTRGLSARLTRAIRDNIANSNWRINVPGGLIWHTTEGLFAIMPAIVTNIEEYMRSKGDHSGLPADVVSISQILADGGHIEESITAKGTRKHVFDVIIEGASDKGGAGVTVKHKVIKFVNEIVIPDYFDLPAKVNATLLDDEGKPITHGGVVVHADEAPAPSAQATVVPFPKSKQKSATATAAAPEPVKPAEAFSVDDAMDEDRAPILYDDLPPDVQIAVSPSSAPTTTNEPAVPVEKASELRDRRTEKDARDAVIDDGVADATKPFPPVRAEDARAWLEGADQLGLHMRYVLHKMEEGEAKWDEHVVIHDDRLYLRYPEIFEDCGTSPGTVMSQLFEAQWIERGPGQTGIPMKVKFGGINAHALRLTRDHTSAMQLLLPIPKVPEKTKVMGPYLQEDRTMLLVGDPKANAIKADGWIYRNAFFQYLSEKHKEHDSAGEWHAADPAALHQLVKNFAKSHGLNERFLLRHLQEEPYPLLRGGENKKKLSPNAAYDPFKDQVMHTTKAPGQ